MPLGYHSCQASSIHLHISLSDNTLSGRRAITRFGIEDARRPALFKRLDASGDGLLGLDEFRLLVRRILKLPPADLPDESINLVFRHLDADRSNEIAPDELQKFVDEERAIVKTKRPEAVKPYRPPHSANTKRSPRVLAHAPPAPSASSVSLATSCAAWYANASDCPRAPITSIVAAPERCGRKS